MKPAGVAAVGVVRRLAVFAWCGFWLPLAGAGIFDDEEARKAVVDLRQRVTAMQAEADLRLQKESVRSAEEAAQIRGNLLQLQNQIEALRAEVARLVGHNEQLTRELAETQKRQRESAQDLENRLRQFEPVKVTVDGVEFLAEAAERREFEAALALFRKSDFAAAQTAFVTFLRRFGLSGYRSSGLFWLGNAQYATRDYKEAIINFRALLSTDSAHYRAPEALLAVGNCQIELGDTKSARKTLEEVMKTYPQSEAAPAAKERLSRLR